MIKHLYNLLSHSSMSGVSQVDGVYTFQAGDVRMLTQQLPTPVVGHKYYGRCQQRVPQNTTFADGRFEYYQTDAGGVGNIVFTSFSSAIQDGQWHQYSNILQFSSLSSQTGWTLRSFTANANNDVYRKDQMIIDLTGCFGEGEEPTKEWCDSNIPYFEGMYTLYTNALQVDSKGVFSSVLFSEIITLQDGSMWQPICCHNINNEDGTYNMFSGADDFSYTVYHSNNLWADFPMIETVTRPESNYEFLVLQQSDINGPWSTYRFKQTMNPMIATWSNVSPNSGNITWITGGSSSYGGIYKQSAPTATSGNYMCFANSSESNWFGCGCKQYYQGGIPSICNSVVKGWQLVYIRISKTNYRIYNSISASNEILEY